MQTGHHGVWRPMPTIFAYATAWSTGLHRAPVLRCAHGQVLAVPIKLLAEVFCDRAGHRLQRRHRQEGTQPGFSVGVIPRRGCHTRLLHPGFQDEFVLLERDAPRQASYGLVGTDMVMVLVGLSKPMSYGVTWRSVGVECKPHIHVRATLSTTKKSPSPPPHILREVTSC